MFENETSVPVKFIIEEEVFTTNQKVATGGVKQSTCFGIAWNGGLVATLIREIQNKLVIIVGAGDYSTEDLQPNYTYRVSIHIKEHNTWVDTELRRIIDPNVVSKFTFMDKHLDVVRTKQTISREGKDMKSEITTLINKEEHELQYETKRDVGDKLVIGLDKEEKKFLERHYDGDEISRDLDRLHEAIQNFSKMHTRC